MTDVRLPAAVGLEWCVSEGEVVAAGQVLAWLAVADHCALLPLTSPAPGPVTARWTALLTRGHEGAVVAAVGGAPHHCRASEREAMDEAIAVARARLASLAPRPERGVANTLLEGERASLLRWLGEAEAWRSARADS